MADDPFTDQDIASAVRDIIYECDLTPRSMITHDVAPGDTRVYVQDINQFFRGGVITFVDDSDEEPLAIKEKHPEDSSLEINFVDTGYDGFQYAHNAGDYLSTALFTDVPTFISPMIQTGNPVIFVTALNEQTYNIAPRQLQSIFVIHIEYRNLLFQKNNGKTATTTWGIRQQKTARTELEVIAKALRSNPYLMTSDGMRHAESLGGLHNGQPWMLRTWQNLVMEDESQQFSAVLTVMVRGCRFIIMQ